jgi:signal transduction histidine kinase
LRKTLCLLVLCIIPLGNSISVAQKLFYFQDKSGIKTCFDIKKQQVKWSPVRGNLIDFGFVYDDAIWLKIEQKKSKSEPQILLIPNASLDTVEFYSKNKTLITGDRVNNENYHYSIPVTEINDSTQFVRIVKSTSKLRIPIKIKSRFDFLKDQSVYFTLDMVLLGVLIAFLIFSVSLYFFSKSKIFLFFSLYVLTSILYYYTSNGILKATFFSKFLYFSEIRLVVSCIAPISLFWFNRSLINYDTKWLNQLSKFLWKSIIVLVVLSFFFVSFIKEHILKEYISLIYTLAFTLILILLYLNIKEIRLRKKNTERRYAFLFLGSIIITLLLYLLESIKISWFPDFDYLLLITCAEVIVFGLFISIDFLKKFSNREQYALNLLEAKKRAFEELKTIQFKERKKISAVLHNRYQSQMAGIRMYLSNILPADSSVLKSLKDYEEEIRLFSHQVLPKELEHGLFNDAIIKHVLFLNKVHSDKKFNFSHFDIPEQMNENWVYDLYLIVSELIQNSIKHSNATEIQIEFYAHPNEYILTYFENGNNFKKADFESGHGAHLIFDQIEQIGAKFKIETSPQLLVIIEIPRK